MSGRPVVVFTTGIMAASARQETVEGIERDMAVSYLSRLVILRGVGDRLRQGARVGSLVGLSRPSARVMTLTAPLRRRSGAYA